MDNMDKMNDKNTPDLAETQLPEENINEKIDTQDGIVESENTVENIPTETKSDSKNHRTKKDTEKNRVVKSKKEPEYLPGMQKKLFVDVREDNDLSFVDKIKAIFNDRRSIFTISIYAAIILNLFGITLFAKNCGLNITQSLLYKVHFDSLSLDTYTFLEISILLAYIFAFIFGGLLTFAMIKLASKIAKNVNAIYSHNFTRIILGVFMLVFIIFTITSYVNSGKLLSIPTQNWFIPLSTFVGGFCMYCISLRNVDIY